MVMAHLQLHDARTSEAKNLGAEEGCLGALLIDFFELYGRRLNAEEVGVSCRDGGRFFAKRDKEWHDPGRPFLLAIEDPQDPSNDLGKNSYGIRQIKAAFEHAFTLLTAPPRGGDGGEEFLLGRIVRMDPKTAKNRPPPRAPGAIAGVAADFPQHADGTKHEEAMRRARDASARQRTPRGRKRKAEESEREEEEEEGADEKEEEEEEEESSYATGEKDHLARGTPPAPRPRSPPPPPGCSASGSSPEAGCCACGPSGSPRPTPSGPRTRPSAASRPKPTPTSPRRA